MCWRSIKWGIRPGIVLEYFAAKLYFNPLYRVLFFWEENCLQFIGLNCTAAVIGLVNATGSS